MRIGAARAYFYTDVARDMYVRLPPKGQLDDEQPILR